MASTDEVLKQLERGSQFALGQAADQLLAEVNSFVPIFTGNLRDSHKIEPVGRTGVRIRNSLPYARYQYFRPLFHPTRGGQLTRMTEVGSASTVGRGDKSRYNSAYRQAKKAGKLQRFRAAWFRPQIVNDPKIKRRVSLRFTKALVSRL